MGTLSRKQRELQQRELMLMDIGRKMLIEQGYAGLSMDRLAEATEYSKGTIYQHFSTKEDLVTALAVQSMERRFALFQKAFMFRGLPRERFAAIAMADELFFRLNPHHYRSELVTKMADLDERASTGRRDSQECLESRCFDEIAAVIGEGIERGDLALSGGMTPKDVIFSVFSMSIGIQMALVCYRPMLEKQGIGDPLGRYAGSVDVMLDGFGWKPLRAEWDYAATRRRIATEVFADEWQRAGLG